MICAGSQPATRRPACFGYRSSQPSPPRSTSGRGQGHRNRQRREQRRAPSTTATFDAPPDRDKSRTGAGPLIWAWRGSLSISRTIALGPRYSPEDCTRVECWRCHRRSRIHHESTSIRFSAGRGPPRSRSVRAAVAWLCVSRGSGTQRGAPIARGRSPIVRSRRPRATYLTRLPFAWSPRQSMREGRQEPADRPLLGSSGSVTAVNRACARLIWDNQRWSDLTFTAPSRIMYVQPNGRVAGSFHWQHVYQPPLAPLGFVRYHGRPCPQRL